MPIFRFPFFYNPGYYNNRYKTYNSSMLTGHEYSQANLHKEKEPKKVGLGSEQIINNVSTDRNKNSNTSEQNDKDYFFELFGLKLYFDDILLMSLIFFLYEEGVKDEELFLSLILLLLS